MVFAMLNKCCSVPAMAIGKRILARLDQLGWDRKDLLERVPSLSPQALSNLIVRDSKRSECDEAIADALGISVLELVYGRSQSQYKFTSAARLEAREPEPLSDPIKQIVGHAERMTQQAQWELLGMAKALEHQHPNVRGQNAQ